MGKAPTAHQSVIVSNEDCPTCGALLGSPCVDTEKGWARDIAHTSRYDAAKTRGSDLAREPRYRYALEVECRGCGAEIGMPCGGTTVSPWLWCLDRTEHAEWEMRLWQERMLMVEGDEE